MNYGSLTNSCKILNINSFWKKETSWAIKLFLTLFLYQNSRKIAIWDIIYHFCNRDESLKISSGDPLNVEKRISKLFENI